MWKYAYDEPVLEGKVVGFTAKLTKLNPIENEYVFVQDVIAKVGLGLQDQQSQVRIIQNGNSFSVETLSFKIFSVDKSGKKNGDAIEVAKKTMTQNSKNIAGEFEKTAKTLSASDYHYVLHE